MRNQAALYPGGLFCGLPRNQVSGVGCQSSGSEGQGKKVKAERLKAIRLLVDWLNKLNGLILEAYGRFH